MDRSLYYSDQQVTMISAITGRISARTNPVPVVMVTHEGCLTVECGPYLVTGQAVFVTAGLPYILHGQGCVRHTIWMDRYPCRLPVGTPPVFALSLRALNAFADFYSQRTADPVDELAEAVGLRRPVLTPEIAAITERIDADSARRLSQLQASRLVDMERTVLLKRFRRETGMTFRSYKNWDGVKSDRKSVV